MTADQSRTCQVINSDLFAKIFSSSDIIKSVNQNTTKYESYIIPFHGTACLH